MKQEQLFSASADIARRAGVVSSSYRTKEGRFILSETDLSRLKIYPEEYVSGLDVIRITYEEAKRLIAENGYQMGEEIIDSSSSEGEETVEENAPAEEETAESASSSSDNENNEEE